jgi:hypothetical protein
MAAGASPTGGIGGIFYFILFLIGMARRSYRRTKKWSTKYVATVALLFAISAVAIINILFVYRFVFLGSSSTPSVLSVPTVGVQLNWQLGPELVFSVGLLLMFVFGYLLIRNPISGLRYKMGCTIMVVISLALLLWLPLGILASLHLVNFPF